MELKLRGVVLKKTVILLFLLAMLLPLTLLAQTAKLPASKAGNITVPLGKIAYVHDKDLWVMDWDGKNQYMVVTAQNADGRISWSPDGRVIAFTRQGMVETKTPENLGGKHKIYDIFLGYLDSAQTRTNWWQRITNTLGAKHPQWLPDGRIMFTNDLSAYLADPFKPNYQTCFIDADGKNYKIHRTDYDDTLYNVLMPTLGPDNKYAFVLYKSFNRVGVAVTTLDKRTFSPNDIGKSVKLMPNMTAPAWSPDGKWLAYINPDMNKQGIYITNFELTENYLVFKPTIGRSLQTYPLSWSPDSKWLTFATTDGSIRTIAITGNQLKQITGSGINLAPAWSQTK